MPYIKKLVMKGFKSFAKETEIPFSKSMNVIVGPNGSGKSNIADALCFVLGRMSMKSIRASKSANLIFAGTKNIKPANEASVKIILDNTDKKFSYPEKEITIERIVRKSGQGIYKINGEVKTRQEVIELLAQGGIDPYGFNIVLQGEIVSIIRTSSEERRKIIEEVAGISIYESRKEKSLRELEKTEERLKEINTTLRERTSYLKNLEEERKQALRYKNMEEIIKRCKASIINKKIKEKEKELERIEKEKEKIEKEKEKTKEKENKLREEIEDQEKEIDNINKKIKEAGGIQQENLNNEISNLRAELAGLDVKKENAQNRIKELEKRKGVCEKEIKTLEEEIKKLREEYPTQAKKYEELEEKKKILEGLEKKKKEFYDLRAKLKSLKDNFEEKKNREKKLIFQSESLMNEIERESKTILFFNKEECEEELQKLKIRREKNSKRLEELKEKIKEREKLIYKINSEIVNLEEIKKKVSEIDICPLCKTKITKEHVENVQKECEEKINSFKNDLKTYESEIKTMDDEIKKLSPLIKGDEEKISKLGINRVKLGYIEEKKRELKELEKERGKIVSELKELEKLRRDCEEKISNLEGIEENYDKTLMEIQEISARTEENLDAELEYKERRKEREKVLIKQIERESSDLKQEIIDIEKEINEKERDLGKKEEEEEKLEKRFQSLINQKEKFERGIHEKNKELFGLQNQISNLDNSINNLKIEIARIKAEKESLETDFKGFENVELINLPINALEEKLNKAKIIFEKIGSVNMRALEIYDKIKKEYDAIREKVITLEKEKEEIIKVIETIDRKKKRTFIKTLKAINSLFNRNFRQLSTKGDVFLELENEKDPFEGGLDIVVKVGKGKYFDIASLSGGEQTLVALSLIFAIQEYKPYAFYVFDEVDAALDKRNSERLASLIKKYMKTGQYIIITHNDAIITESTLLYGVSMQEGISKIISLEI